MKNTHTTVFIAAAVSLLATSNGMVQAYEHPMFKQFVEAAVTAIYYQNNCNPGALSLRTVQVMSQLIKIAEPETVATGHRHIREAVQRYGGAEQYCAAMNTPGFLKSLRDLQEAIEALPRE